MAGSFHTPAPGLKRRAGRGEVGRGSGCADNARMDIRLNGAPRALTAPCSIERLLEDAGLAGRRVAVEVNGEIVPRGLHASHELREGDRVEIVHALGGG
jgi:sulfur carrier protein